jgi:hypothetical protein
MCWDQIVTVDGDRSAFKAQFLKLSPRPTTAWLHSPLFHSTQQTARHGKALSNEQNVW